CNKAIDIIESDLSKRWTLQSLSDIFNISEVAIRKKLESEGVNFKELITETRMKKALSMMIEGNFNISQIAMCVGYKNTSYFISSFKKFFGVTPKQLQLSLI
ncbi:helix-turn-helix transcriptional regulator, partial [Escherichia coli O91]|nr:helix-turn-helix transcriptional regulator [Escherichia coli O91]